MAASMPLTGSELIDCAKANAKQGLEIAAQQCGYGNNHIMFEENLKQACQEIGVDIQQLSDLITAQQTVRERGGIEVAPETLSEL
ncbi:MAG TPA: hypothetical protein DDZ80_21130 [Cyanobacteria bacterium UBA8803]|nr:hypothetical protein [Cyanobacteria bacterium UBA9273]HBL60846.1 hypothetical protein [Cyanobacteria bacterium UBA8803]